jgi:hypothetical protein
MSERGQSFLSLLLEKLANMIKIEKQTGISTAAAQREVWRQIRQISLEKGGDPITGRGVTKSGEED